MRDDSEVQDHELKSKYRKEERREKGEEKKIYYGAKEHDM